MGLISRWRRSRRAECWECGQKLSPVIISQARGDCGDVQATFNRLPTLGCKTSSHPKIFVRRDFGKQLLDAIFVAGEIPSATSTSGADLQCQGCGSVAERPKLHDGSVQAAFSSVRVPSFHLEITGPLFNCRTCGLKQLAAYDDMRRKIVGAIGTALERAGIEPSILPRLG